MQLDTLRSLLSRAIHNPKIVAATASVICNALLFVALFFVAPSGKRIIMSVSRQAQTRAIPVMMRHIAPPSQKGATSSSAGGQARTQSKKQGQTQKAKAASQQKSVQGTKATRPSVTSASTKQATSVRQSTTRAKQQNMASQKQKTQKQIKPRQSQEARQPANKASEQVRQKQTTQQNSKQQPQSAARTQKQHQVSTNTQKSVSGSQQSSVPRKKAEKTQKATESSKRATSSQSVASRQSSQSGSSSAEVAETHMQQQKNVPDQIDVREVPESAYQYMMHEVTRAWHPPAGLGGDLTCHVKVAIASNGSVSHVKLEESSGVLAFDMAARAALWRISEYPRSLWGHEVVIVFG